MPRTSLITIYRCHMNAAIMLLLSFIAGSAGAQKFSTVISLRSGSESVSSVNMNIFPPGKGGNKAVVNINDRLETGTKMIVPGNVVVVLRSTGGTQVIKSIGGKPFEYTVEFTAQGENHTVKGLGAQIENTVKKTVGYNYRNSNEKGTTAASKGTVFTFTDFSNKDDEKASISTTEGVITIIDKVPCSLNGQLIKNSRKGGVATKAVSRTQQAGDETFTSSDEPIDYTSLDWAVDYINKEIEDQDTDPEDIADDLMCLGDLYMNMEKPAEAIQPYDRAAKYYLGEYGDDDLSTLEARLSLAEANIEAENDEKGMTIAEESIAILEEILDIDLDDLDFSKQDNDAEAIDFICSEITDIYDLLGWAYSIKGDDATSEEYYSKAEAGCE
ncbi:MAG TPA: tetratricopeptide repeat protein [Parafilimonas sp.]|nr:tetratricopeptide repeat protein [Parafilimonas sp.]